MALGEAACRERGDGFAQIKSSCWLGESHLGSVLNISQNLVFSLQTEWDEYI